MFDKLLYTQHGDNVGKLLIELAAMLDIMGKTVVALGQENIREHSVPVSRSDTVEQGEVLCADLCEPEGVFDRKKHVPSPLVSKVLIYIEAIESHMNSGV